MQELLNPYRVGRVVVAGAAVPGARVAATALVGVAVVAGCTTGPVDPPSTAVPQPSGPMTPSTVPPPTTALAPAPAPAPESGGTRVQLRKPGADYTVVRGDTLSELAVTFRVRGGWPALFERNRDVLWDPDLILIGQQLDIDGQP